MQLSNTNGPTPQLPLPMGQKTTSFKTGLENQALALYRTWAQLNNWRVLLQNATYSMENTCHLNSLSQFFKNTDDSSFTDSAILWVILGMTQLTSNDFFFPTCFTFSPVIIFCMPSGFIHLFYTHMKIELKLCPGGWKLLGQGLSIQTTHISDKLIRKTFRLLKASRNQSLVMSQVNPNRSNHSPSLTITAFLFF